MLIYETLEKLHFHLLRSRHRSMVILDGNFSWAKQYVREFSGRNIPENSGGNSLENLLTYSELESELGQVNRKTYTHHLGTENNYLFFIDPQLNIDALAALSGTIVAGGICFLWVNSEAKIPAQTHFLSRFMRFFDESYGNYYVSESSHELLTLDEAPLLVSSVGTESNEPSIFTCTEQQKKIISLIGGSIKEKKNSPVVLTADRGRGKSTALAIICAQFLMSNSANNQVVITAPNRAALNIFYQHLERELLKLNKGINREIQHRNSEFIVGSNSVKYLPVDQLIKLAPKLSLLLVDEAAGIPVHLLKRLLSLSNACVFSSTVHGYEGAGSGFSLKFLPIIKAGWPDYKLLHLSQPVRWAENDPLESLLFDTCLLNAQLSDVITSAHNKAQSLQQSVSFSLVDQEELFQNEYLLKHVFSVLVTAHYQTKPSDLKMLLDNPQVKVFVLFSAQNQVLAVALTLKEGELPPELIKAVQQGKRRVKNQFLPQSILTQCVNNDAFNYRYLRVVRIAVHPSLQNTGLGTHLLSSVEGWAKDNNIDCIGTSFAANTAVCRFWLKNNFSITRLGFTADASSGEHSMMMLKGFNDIADVFVEGLNKAFYQSFDYLLTDEYQQLSVTLVRLILSKNTYVNALRQTDIDKLFAFVQGQVQYSCIVYELHQWLLFICTHHDVEHDKLVPLIARVLMKHPIASVCEHYGFTGKKALNYYIIDAVSERLKFRSS